LNRDMLAKRSKKTVRGERDGEKAMSIVC
jgi:hypothetical protein